MKLTRLVSAGPPAEMTPRRSNLASCPTLPRALDHRQALTFISAVLDRLTG